MDVQTQPNLGAPYVMTVQNKYIVYVIDFTSPVSLWCTFRDKDTARSLMKAEGMNGWKAFKG